MTGLVNALPILAGLAGVALAAVRIRRGDVPRPEQGWLWERSPWQILRFTAIVLVSLTLFAVLGAWAVNRVPDTGTAQLVSILVLLGAGGVLRRMRQQRQSRDRFR